ncbi:MAG: nucleotidyltransferase family protein [Thermoplasmataceae archaeon]
MVNIIAQRKETILSNEEVIQRITRILNKFKIKKASIFGSRAKGTYNDRSDIDLIVEFPDGCGLMDLISLKEEIENETGIKADILTFSSINIHLKENILKEQVRII